MWLIRIGSQARTEFVSWCERRPVGTIRVPVWAAHELHKRLRRRASAALKTVGDLDETAVEAGDPAAQKAAALQDAAKNVETVETQARMLVGRFLDEDERLTALKARLRQEIIQEVLDIVNAFVDPSTYQKIRRQLMK